MFRNITTNPTITYVDGKITEDSVVNIIDAIERSSTILDKEVGLDTGTFLSSIASALKATGSSLVPHVKYGVIINGCSDALTISGKEYILSMVPDSPSSITFSSGSYTYTPTEVFTNSNQYTVSGRIIKFSSVPSVVTLTLVYDGYVPEDYGANINDQTLFPIPENIALGRVSKPVLSAIDLAQNIYSISVDNETYLAGVDSEFTTAISNSIPTFLSSYVSSTGTLETPLDYASLWKLTDAGYIKIDLEYFKIISANSFIVKTVSPVDITGTYVVSLFSKGVQEMIAELYIAYKNHNHDNLGNSKRVSHENLINDESKDYHPQYIAKAGYSSLNKNNMMTGDLFLSSSDPSDDGSNTISSSRRLVFGNYTSGHSINRETGDNGFIRIDSRESNGLNIIVNPPIEGTDSKVALKFCGASLYGRQEALKAKQTTVFDVGEKLVLESESGLDTDKIETRLLDINDGSIINIGGVKIEGTSTGATVITDTDKELSIEGSVKFKSGVFDGATVNEVIIPDTKKIIFNNSQDFLQSTSTGPLFKNRINISEYSSLNVTSENDQQPLSLSNITSVRSNNPVYFIKPIFSGTIHNGETYSFRETISGQTRIDRVQDWIRQDIVIGKIDTYGVVLPDSSFKEKNGLDIGVTGKIYSTSDDITCAIDTIVIESKDDIIFLKYGDTSTGCNNKQFAGLMSGKLTVNGSISSTGGIITESNIGCVNLSVDGDIEGVGNLIIEKVATLNSVKVSGTAAISGKASLQDVEVSGTISVNTLEVNGNAEVLGDFNIGKSISSIGTLSVGKNASFGSDVSIEGRITSSKITSQQAAFEGMSVSGDATISGLMSISKIDISGDATIGGQLISASGSFKNSVSAQKIESSDAIFSKLTVDGKSSLKDAEFTGSISVSDNINAIGKITSGKGLAVENGARIYGGLILSEGLKVSDGIDAAGGLKISGDTELSGALTAGETTVKGNIVGTGSLSIKDGLAIIKNLEVTSKAEFSKISTETIYLSGEITGLLESSARIGSIETGSLTLGSREGHDDKLTSYVKAEFLKEVFVAGLLEGNLIRAKSVFTLGEADSDNAVYLTTDGLNFSKSTAVLSVHEITMDKLIGRKDIQYTELSQFNSSISSGIINAIEASKFVISDNLSVEGILNVPRSLVVGGTIFFNKMVPLDTSSGFVDIVAGAAVYE